VSTIVNKPVVTLVATRDLDAAARVELFEFCDRFSSRHQHRFDAQLAKDETVFLVRGSVNFRDSYPQAGRRFPPRESAYAEQVLARLGSQWDPATGVVARGGVSFYREGRVDKEDVDQADPDIAFYITANPGQAEGDSLVCLAPLTLKNFAYIACRQLRRRKEAGAGRRRRQRGLSR
jgi:hypothetical protein